MNDNALFIWLSVVFLGLFVAMAYEGHMSAQKYEACIARFTPQECRP